MKRLIFISIITTILCFSALIAAPFDTDYIEWQQPNGITFVARHWGDEFEWWMETHDGYRIIKGYDGWYYYANLNSKGEFKTSAKKVGIDLPLAQSFQLDRSQQ